MKVTMTELANHSKRVLDRMMKEGAAVEVQRHGRTVAEIRPKAGASKKELLRILKHIRWTVTESRELKRAMDAASEVFGYVGRD